MAKTPLDSHYKTLLEERITAAVRAEGVADRRALSQAGRDRAIEEARALAGTPTPSPTAPMTREQAFAAAEAILKARPELVPVLEGLSAGRSSPAQLREMDDDSFRTHLARSTIESARQRMARPGRFATAADAPNARALEAAALLKQDPNRVTAKALREMDDDTFRSHLVAATVATSRRN